MEGDGLESVVATREKVRERPSENERVGGTVVASYLASIRGQRKRGTNTPRGERQRDMKREKERRGGAREGGREREIGQPGRVWKHRVRQREREEVDGETCGVCGEAGGSPVVMATPLRRSLVTPSA